MRQCAHLNALQTAFGVHSNVGDLGLYTSVAAVIHYNTTRWKGEPEDTSLQGGLEYAQVRCSVYLYANFSQC